MRRYISALMLMTAFCFAPLTVWAESPAAPGANTAKVSGVSLGIILGDPTGLTLRVGLTERNALQAHFGFSPFPGSAVVGELDWTYDAWNFLRNNSTAELLFYFGAGGKMEWLTGDYYAYEYNHRHDIPDRSHFGLGIRALLGLRTVFLKAPFDLFFEVAPLGILFVVPNPGVYYDFDAAIGFRYRF